MATLLHLNWQVCPDGYRLVSPPPGRPKGLEALGTGHAIGPVIVPVSEDVVETEPLQINGVYMELAHTPKTTAGALRFIERFGFLDRQKVCPPALFYQAIDGINAWLAAAERNDWRGLADALAASHRDNMIGVSVGRAGPVIAFDDGKPVLKFQPARLIDAIYLQLLHDKTRGLDLRQCKNPTCPRWFTYGPGGERKRDAEYCSPRCQGQHYQKRQEEKK